MILLFDYYKGRTLQKFSFADSEMDKATQLRLEIELALLRQNKEHEVVTQEGESEDDIKITHSKYFGD